MWFIVDVFSQRIVAWHASTSKATDLVMIPLRMAIWQRDHEGHPVVASQLIHHSDAGSQYTSIRLTEHLALEGIQPSIGSVGDAYDNAAAARADHGPTPTPGPRPRPSRR
jgi:putative transposase